MCSFTSGTATPGIAEILHELGYRAFCVSDPGLVTTTTDRFAVPRIAVKRHTPSAFLGNVLAGRTLTLAGLRSSWAVKRIGKRLIGTDTWRLVRSALTTVGRLAKASFHMTGVPIAATPARAAPMTSVRLRFALPAVDRGTARAAAATATLSPSTRATASCCGRRRSVDRSTPRP